MYINKFNIHSNTIIIVKGSSEKMLKKFTYYTCY